MRAESALSTGVALSLNAEVWSQCAGFITSNQVKTAQDDIGPEPRQMIPRSSRSISRVKYLSTPTLTISQSCFTTVSPQKDDVGADARRTSKAPPSINVTRSNVDAFLVKEAAIYPASQ
jgi:hypothetical protein